MLGEEEFESLGFTVFEEDRVECEIDLTELEVARQFRPALRDTRVEIFDTIREIYKLTWGEGKEYH